MLFRFSLYGFLKNQQYFDPFLLLAFLEKGLSYTWIGTLIGFRELCVNLMEIPTGAIADTTGRRRAMIFSFIAYIGSFLLLGLVTNLPLLFVAMFLFSIGDAFRTGTHKAMIFGWLARQNRQNDKTEVYGFTRSWSKLGSALSVVIAATLVFFTERYSWIFLVCIGPYLLNIVNFLGYPDYLDETGNKSRSLSNVFRTLLKTIRSALTNRSLRRLFAESMGFEGVYKASKDYLQPVLRSAAIALPVLVFLDDRRRTAVLVGIVYFVLYLLSSYASRHSHLVAKRAGSEQRGAKWLWLMDLAAFCVMATGIVLQWMALTAIAFVALAIIQNFWRPLLVSRFAGEGDPKQHATVLSIESQAKSLSAAIVAPLLGIAIDTFPERWKFAPIAILGLVIAAGMFLTARSEPPENVPAIKE